MNRLPGGVSKLADFCLRPIPHLEAPSRRSRSRNSISCYVPVEKEIYSLIVLCPTSEEHDSQARAPYKKSELINSGFLLFQPNFKATCCRHEGAQTILFLILCTVTYHFEKITFSYNVMKFVL